MSFKKLVSKTVTMGMVAGMVLGFQACAKKQIKKSPGIEQGDIEDIGGKVGPVKVGYSGKMYIVHFEFDKYRLSEEAREGIKQNVEWLRQNRNVRVQVEGHCDSRGTQGYNLALGQKRADAVREYMINLGVGSERITTISYGEERPLRNGEDEEAWAVNRRAEFIITDT